MLQVTVKITGNEELRTKLNLLGKDLYMLKGAMDEIGQSLQDYYANVGISSQGGVFGAKWAPLNRKYALWKAKRYPGRSPLVATGTMQKSYYHTSTQTSVYVGNKDPIFVYHQSSAPRSKIPRRVTIGINSAVKTDVKEKIAYAVNKKIKALGL